MPPKPNNPPYAASSTLLPPQSPGAVTVTTSVSAALATSSASTSASASASASASQSSTTSNVKAKQPSQKPKKSGAGGGTTKPTSATAAAMPSSSAVSGGGTSKIKTPSSSSASSLPPSHKRPVTNTSTSSSTTTAPASSSTPILLSSTATSEKQLAQFKIERALIAERELAEMDALERAFREDEAVWIGPTNVVFPRRYHSASAEIVFDDNNGTNNKGEGNARRGSSNGDATSSTHYYGSQSRGWMYGEGYAGIGGRSWMEATKTTTETKSKPSSSSSSQQNQKQPHGAQKKKSDPSFLFDDVAIVDASLRANGLSRRDVSPAAYACLLEQARRCAYELLADAQDYAVHARRNNGILRSLQPADLLLAAEMMMLAANDTSNLHTTARGGGDILRGVASALPTPEELSEFASAVNRAPLPPIPSHCYDGVALPPAEEQLTARTYDVANGARVAQRMMRGGDLPLTCGDSLGATTTTAVVTRGEREGECGKMTKSSSSSGDRHGSKGTTKNAASVKTKQPKTTGSYGAGQGRQIAVRLKSKPLGANNNDAAKTGTVGDDGGGATTTTVASGATIAPPPTSKKGQKRSLREL